jgi:hypothetical protein
MNNYTEEEVEEIINPSDIKDIKPIGEAERIDPHFLRSIGGYTTGLSTNPHEYVEGKISDYLQRMMNLGIKQEVNLDNLQANGANQVVVNRPPLESVSYFQFIGQDSNNNCTYPIQIVNNNSNRLNLFMEHPKWKKLNIMYLDDDSGDTNYLLEHGTFDVQRQGTDADLTTENADIETANRISVPNEFDPSCYDSIADVIRIFEVGKDNLSPAYLWSKQNRNAMKWSATSFRNFGYFCKIYVYINQNYGQSINMESRLEKTMFRNQAKKSEEDMTWEQYAYFLMQSNNLSSLL